jgi:uncharacterized protein
LPGTFSHLLFFLVLLLNFDAARLAGGPIFPWRSSEIGGPLIIDRDGLLPAIREAQGACAIEGTTLYVLSIMFLATALRSSLGFGEALIAVPLLAFFIPITIAAPLAVLVSVTIAAVIILQDWRKIHFHSAVWLIIPTIFGIPFGLLLLKSSHQRGVKTTLAALLLAFALYSLAGKQPARLVKDSRPWLLFCGFLAGVFGGAYGMNGPPLAIYGAMRRWSAQHFRATLQGYFLPAGVLGLVGYAVSGLWTASVTHLYLISLPVVLPTIFLGSALNHRLQPDDFLRYVYAGLALIACLLFVQAMRGV